MTLDNEQENNADRFSVPLLAVSEVFVLPAVVVCKSQSDWPKCY